VNTAQKASSFQLESRVDRARAAGEIPERPVGRVVVLGGHRAAPRLGERRVDVAVAPGHLGAVEELRVALRVVAAGPADDRVQHPLVRPRIDSVVVVEVSPL